MDVSVDTAPAPPAVRSLRDRRRRWIVGLLAALIVVALLVLAWWLVYARFYESTDDAYVAGDLVNVMSQVNGTVVSIGADETDLVAGGQELVRLDATDARIALQDAEQQLARTVRQTRTVFATRDQLQAVVDQRRADLARAQATQVERAWLALVRTSVRAPVKGYVARRSVQLGERIAPGAPLMSLVPLGRLWLEANFREIQLRHMRIGQPATVVADLYGGRVTYHGRVAGLGLGTGSAFALLPAQNATGNWIKVVQRVPVRIELDARELAAHPLRIGLSTVVRVDLHDTSGAELAQTPRREPVLETSAYDIDTGEIRARIEQFINDNSAE